LAKSRAAQVRRKPIPRLVKVEVEAATSDSAAQPGWEFTTPRGRLVVHGLLDVHQLSAVLRALVRDTRRP
jgi:hypothetical protein